MLARVLAMALCVCVCPFLSQSEFYRNGWMNQYTCSFDMGPSFHLSYTVLKGNFGSVRNKGSFLELCPKLRTCFASVSRSTRQVDAQSVINWTVVGYLS